MSDAHDQGTFSVSASSTINAPIDLVWKVLLGFQDFKEWNPFVRSLEMNSHGSNDHNIEIGKTVCMTVNIPPTLEDSSSKPQKAQCLVTVLNHENYSVEWKANMLPSMILRSYRVQRLREELRDNGEKVTIYETKEAFGGLLARIIWWTVGSGVQEGFEAMAQGLKKRSEQLAGHNT